ncbi:MAG TPA: hypothetical protein VHR45_19210 [Thermoanaerobaculia bacterium]|nr:hypothetical protein [Thermoanaerobaculia bacterium]
MMRAPAERRLRSLAVVCCALATGVLADAGAIVWLVGSEERRPWAAAPSPPLDSFLLCLAAMLVILLSAGVHARILRRALEREAPPEGPSGDDPPGSDWPSQAAGAGPDERPRLERRAAGRILAYVRATVATFALLELAAAAGLAAALASRSSFYGLVVCGTSLLAMIARWPRPSSLERLLAAEEDG